MPLTKNCKLAIFIILVGTLTSQGAGPAVWAGDAELPIGVRPEGDTGPMASALRLFSATVSKVDGHRCAMYPSCSAYSALAFEKHGFVKGWILTSDRLLRCGRDEKRLSETILIDRQPHVYDPLPHNDFWWSAP